MTYLFLHSLEYFGIVATICTHQEIQSLLYAGFFHLLTLLVCVSDVLKEIEISKKVIALTRYYAFLVASLHICDLCQTKINLTQLVSFPYKDHNKVGLGLILAI